MSRTINDATVHSLALPMSYQGVAIARLFRPYPCRVEISPSDSAVPFDW